MRYEIFRSKRFWTALLGILSMILVAFVPELEEYIETLIPGILGIVGIVIGGYTLQDTALAYNGQSKYSDTKIIGELAYDPTRQAKVVTRPDPTTSPSDSFKVEAAG